MTLHLKSIKTEFRVLGIDACNRTRTIGIVYRGGLYLDGVLLPTQGANSAKVMGRAIRESKYFPELKILMLHDPSVTLDPELVQKETRLPLLTISTKRPRGDKSVQSFRSSQGKLWVRSPLDEAFVHQILDLTWIAGRLPEPVRVAHLLGRSIRFSPFRQGKE